MALTRSRTVIPGCAAALEADQHRLRHVQREVPLAGGKRHQVRACREAQADGEAGVAVAARPHEVGQQESIAVGVDDAVAGPQVDAAHVRR